jgi:molybdopterin/thiamine biosynthesis adenylyltransferase
VGNDLSDSERERYAAQIEAFGTEGQLRLKASRAIVIGAGRRGATAAGVLASSGLGYAAVVDGATVQPRDLVGQLSHYAPDVGANKAEAVAAKLGFLNPQMQADSYPVALDASNAAAIVYGHDLVLDCTGDAAVAAIVASACAGHDIPLLRPAADQADPAGGSTAVVAGAEVAREALALLAMRAEVQA